MEGPNVELGEPEVNVNPYVVGLDEELPGDAITPTAASDNTINNKHQRY